MELFIIPIIVMILAQLIKMLAEALKGDFNWENLNNYGGMPSSHAALVTSLVYILYYSTAEYSAPAMAVAVVLLLLVLRDAVGFRRQLGLHAKLINMLIKELPDKAEYKYPVLHERLGHSVPEIIGGVITGIILTYLALLII